MTITFTLRHIFSIKITESSSRIILSITFVIGKWMLPCSKMTSLLCYLKKVFTLPIHCSTTFKVICCSNSLSPFLEIYYKKFPLNFISICKNFFFLLINSILRSSWSMLHFLKFVIHVRHSFFIEWLFVLFNKNINLKVELCSIPEVQVIFSFS